MQLEQVLKHYSLHPADSLKYRAACYLIANMRGMAGMRERPSMFINNGSIRFTVDKASFLKRLCTKHSFNNPVQRKGWCGMKISNNWIVIF